MDPQITNPETSASIQEEIPNNQEIENQNTIEKTASNPEQSSPSEHNSPKVMESEPQNNENHLNEMDINRIPEEEPDNHLDGRASSTSSVMASADGIPRKWEWLPCNYELKREERGAETYWSLTPIIQLVNPDTKSVPETDTTLELERPFMFNSEVGWNWHKSWNLPNITVNLKITDGRTNNPILPPADLKAQLLAVKVLLHRVEQVKLFDLGLKGSTIQDLSDGMCTFSGVKFSSTSYNNEGVKFHLIVLVYIQEDSRNRACPKILYSKISPPIFVDSRKAARNSHIHKNKKISSIYFDSFPPDTFTRTFIKRNNKLNDTKEEVIEDNLGGLCHYFTAPNIRNKIKHPIFLTYRFSSCVKLYYNVEFVKKQLNKSPEEFTLEDLIYVMQKVFLENYHNKKNKGDFATPQNKAFDNKYFILLIEEPDNPDSFSLNKKIADYLEPIINEVLHVIFNSNLVPSHFKSLPTDNLAGSYVAVYPKLAELRDIYGPIEQEEEDEDEPITKSTPTSKHNNINSKRDRSEAETSDIEDMDSEQDEEDVEVTKQSVPQKKVKAAVGSRKSKRTTIETGFYSEAATSLKQAAQQAKEATKNTKKAQPKKSNNKGATSNQAEQSDTKTESEDLLLKSEPDTSTGFYDKISIISSSDQGSKAKKPPTKAVTAVKPNPEKLTSMPSMSLDMIASLQQQMAAADPQNIMNLMYQNLSKAPQEGGNFAELLAGANFMQNKSPDLYQQQQQQYFQAQLALQQMQQQKQQHQLLQLQQQLRFMQAKSGMEYDKEKEFASRMAQGEGLPAHLSSMSKAMTQQNFANMLPRNYQFPGSMPGFGNLPFNPSLSDFSLANGYNGLSMGSPLEGKPIPPYMNLMQEPNASKTSKAFRNE